MSRIAAERMWGFIPCAKAIPLTVIITHNAVMAEMADRIVHLSDGRIVSSHRNEIRLAASELKW